MFKVAISCRGGVRKDGDVLRRMIFLFCLSADVQGCLFCRCFLHGKLASHCCVSQNLEQIGQK